MAESIQCPHCGGRADDKGPLKSGAHRYRCVAPDHPLGQSRSFSVGGPRDRAAVLCDCGQLAVKKGFTKAGGQRWLCKMCRKSWTAN